MKFNVNHYVRVKLTDIGRAELERQASELRAKFQNMAPYKPIEEDEEGWSRWQLWCLMQELGHLCGLGVEPPFETEIEIEVDIPQ